MDVKSFLSGSLEELPTAKLDLNKLLGLSVSRGVHSLEECVYLAKHKDYFPLGWLTYNDLLQCGANGKVVEELGHSIFLSPGIRSGNEILEDLLQFMISERYLPPLDLGDLLGDPIRMVRRWNDLSVTAIHNITPIHSTIRCEGSVLQRFRQLGHDKITYAE